MNNCKSCHGYLAELESAHLREKDLYLALGELYAENFKLQQLNKAWEEKYFICNAAYRKLKIQAALQGQWTYATPQENGLYIYLPKNSHNACAVRLLRDEKGALKYKSTTIANLIKAKEFKPEDWNGSWIKLPYHYPTPSVKESEVK